jgi:hypothetical protein
MNRRTSLSSSLPPEPEISTTILTSNRIILFKLRKRVSTEGDIQK